MIRKVVPFRRWHYDWLGPAAEGSTVKIEAALLEMLEAQNSWTGVVDGDVIACAGTIQQWPGRHVAWAYLSHTSGPHMGWITRQVRKNLEGVQGRIELTVRADFEAGLRWAKLLGFDIETPRLRQFGPAGEDHVGFVRFN